MSRCWAWSCKCAAHGLRRGAQRAHTACFIQRACVRACVGACVCVRVLLGSPLHAQRRRCCSPGARQLETSGMGPPMPTPVPERGQPQPFIPVQVSAAAGSRTP